LAVLADQYTARSIVGATGPLGLAWHTGATDPVSPILSTFLETREGPVLKTSTVVFAARSELRRCLTIHFLAAVSIALVRTLCFVAIGIGHGLADRIGQATRRLRVPATNSRITIEPCALECASQELTTRIVQLFATSFLHATRPLRSASHRGEIVGHTIAVVVHTIATLWLRDRRTACRQTRHCTASRTFTLAKFVALDALGPQFEWHPGQIT